MEDLDLAEAAKVIKSGGVVVMPTDTVYGIVCSALLPAAVERLYSLKSRQNNPGPIIAANVDQLVGLGIKKSYLTHIQHYWPNPISIEVPHRLTYLHQGTGRQALRVVKPAWLRRFLQATNALLTSSANLPGQPTSTDIAQAKKYFGDKVDLYVDGGELDQPASTVIALVDDAVDVVRQGAVKIDQAGRIIN